MVVKKRIMAAVVGVAMLGIASASQAATIFTSSFESPSIAPSTYLTYTAGSSVDGWTVGGGGVDVILAPYFSPSPFPDGVQALDLNALTIGSISRSFATVTAQDYMLEFFLAQNSGTGGTVQVSIDSNPAVATAITSTNASWVKYQVPFTAGGVSTTLKFETNSPAGSGGPTLDAISVSTVPLPASVYSGLGLLGLMAAFKFRRKLA